MATIEQRLKKLEAKGATIADDDKWRFELDKEDRVVQVFFKTYSGVERPVTADQLKSIQVRWDAMTKFMEERGFETVFDFIDDEKLRAECDKAMEDALQNWRQ